MSNMRKSMQSQVKHVREVRHRVRKTRITQRKCEKMRKQGVEHRRVKEAAAVS